MKANFSGSYVSKKGNAVFMYDVTCTPEEKEHIKSIKGDNYRETPGGLPIFRTVRYAGESCTLLITTNNNWIVDNSESQKLQSTLKQQSPEVKNALSVLIAQDLYAAIKRGTRVSIGAPVSTPVSITEPAKVEEPVDTEGLGDM